MAYFESLPYIDPEPSEPSLHAARALIAAEQSTFQPAPLPPLREPSFTPLLSTHIAHISSGKPSTKLDLSRYEAQDIIPPSSSSADQEPLRTALRNATVSSEYLSSRTQNLTLLSTHGKNAWLLGNYTLESELKSLERDLANTKRDIDLLNAARAASQNHVKAEMLSLEQNWRDVLDRVVETEIAVEQLRGQIREELKAGAALAAAPVPSSSS